MRESPDEEVECVHRSVNEEYLPGKGLWCCDDVSKVARVDLVDEAFDTLKDLASQNQGPPLNFDLHVCVVGDPKSGKSAIAAMIKHRFSACVLEFNGLIKQVYANLAEPSENIDCEWLEGLDEDVACKVLKDVRDETKGDVQQARTSVHLAKLVALKAASLSDGCWVIDGFPTTLQQAQMFDFICSDIANINATTKQFDEYCKERGEDLVSKTAHCTMLCSFASEAEESNVEWIRQWTPRLVVLEDKPRSQDIVQYPQGAGIDVDEPSRASFPSREQFVNDGEQALVDAMELDITAKTEFERLLPGVALFRKHLEACDPNGTGKRLDLGMAEIILDKWEVQRKVYQAKLRQVFHRLNRLEADRWSKLEEAKAKGSALILEQALPAGVERPSEKRMLLVEDFRSKDDRQPGARTTLEKSLWRTAFEYSRRIEQDFIQFEAEMLDDEEVHASIQDIILQLVETEEENFSAVRSLLQATLRHFPLPRRKDLARSDHPSKSTLALAQDPIIPPSIGERLIDAQTKLNLHHWRDLRNTQLAGCIADLAYTATVRLQRIASYTQRWETSYKSDVSITFEALRSENGSRLASLDHDIRSKVRNIMKSRR